MTEQELLDQVEQLPGDVSEPLETVEAVEAPEGPRLFLTTPFEEYTVTEGLLLMLLLLAVVAVCVKLVKGGFSWL